MFFCKSREFDRFYERIQHYVATAPAGSLAAMCKQAPSTAMTKSRKSNTALMFAMMETLATNTMRAGVDRLRCRC